jgi:sugar phosphate permease
MSLVTANSKNNKLKNKAFIVLSICSVFLFYKYIAQLFPSVIAQDLLSTYKFSSVELAIMASSYYYSYSFLQVIAGYLIDRNDVRIPCFLAILFISIAMIMFCYTPNFYILCISRFFMGVGASLATVLYMKCAAVWTTPKAFGIISSLLATVTMFGAAFGSAPIAFFFDHVGWHNGLYIIATIGIILAFLALIFVTNNGSNIKPPETKLNFRVFNTILAKKSNWLLFIYAGITFSPIIIIGGLWGNPFLIEKFHITNIEASKLLFMMFIGVGVGAPIWATISAALNARKALMHLANLISILSLFGILYLDLSYNITTILFFVLGFAVGCFMLCFQICKEINPIYIMGMAIAFVNMSDGIFSAIIEPLIGLILDSLKTGTTISLTSYKIALSMLIVCYLISSLTLIFLKTKSNKVLI